MKAAWGERRSSRAGSGPSTSSPIAGTDSCQSAHLAYFVSGQMTVRMDDGEEQTFGPGDYMKCPPGHDAWTVGNEPCVVIDWQGSPTTRRSADLPRELP